MQFQIKMTIGLSTVALLAMVLAGPRAHADPAPATQPAAAPLFSEDFESGELKPEIWVQRVNSGGTVSVQHDVAAHGKNALMAHYPAGVRAYAFAVVNHVPDALKTHFFGRAYVNFPNPIPAGHVVFATAGTEGWPTSNFFEIGNRQNKMQLSYQQNGKDVTRGETMIAGPAYPTGKWFCLEWEFNDKPDSITIWIDGEKVSESKSGYKGATEDFVK